MRSLLPVSLLALGCCTAAPLSAQSPWDAQSGEVHTTTDTSSNGAILAAILAPVKGEPFVTQKVTHSVWRLADGTVITHEADTKMARDGEGRVREEVQNTYAGSTGGEQLNHTFESVTIGDPIDHSMIIMTGTAKLALRMELPSPPKAAAGGVFGGIVGGIAPPPIAVAGRARTNSSGSPKPGTKEKDEVTTEELGTQALGGVRVTGKRTTTVIPTGKIGNDRPITVVHEEWYSPDLKLVVKSLDNDPRSGERTMELQGLTLGEPDASLFRVPEGYQMHEMGDMLKPAAKTTAR